MKSRNGIYYNLENSEYRHTVDGVTYVFSSKLHRDNFINRLEENRESINSSLSNRFNFAVEVNRIADCVLYRKIEKRGFLIVTNEGSIWQNNHLKCDGVKLMKNCSEKR